VGRFIADRLIPSGWIDDGEPAVTQHTWSIGLGEDSVGVGTTMSQPTHHDPNRVSVGAAPDACNATH
jgi:hypothetical protein